MADSSTSISNKSIKFTLKKNLSTPGSRYSLSIISSENNQLMPTYLEQYFGRTGDLNAVLTLLKNEDGSSAAIYSLSIDTSNNTIIIPKYTDEPSFKQYYYNMRNTLLVNYKNVSNKTTKYILIIGELEKYIDPAAPADAADPNAAPDEKSSLEIKKIIFIFDSSSSPQNLVIANVDLSKEEFLNLYYIDYFSFDDGKFTEKYTQFINPPALKPGGSTLVKKKKKAK